MSYTRLVEKKSFQRTLFTPMKIQGNCNTNKSNSQSNVTKQGKAKTKAKGIRKDIWCQAFRYSCR